METDPPVLRSRRGLLAAGLGAVAATVASAFGRPAPVRAGSDGDVVLGASNTTAGQTSITKTTTANSVLYVAAAAGGGSGVTALSDGGPALYGFGTSSYGLEAHSSSGYGVYGQSTSNVGVYGDSADHPGVVGTSTNSFGVSGTSPNGTGVAGSSGVGTGVSGHSNATNRAGTVGQSDGDSTGVMGISGSPLPDAPGKTGVYGRADQDTGARGIWGESLAGRGVYGETASGQGVRGYAKSGSALYGSTVGLKKGLALRTVGRVKFDNSVGIATIPSGTNHVTVTPGIDLQATSAVVATIQGNPAGTMTVRSVAVDAAADTFTIYLTANATATMTIAWHVFG